jgi:uncharacterized membrane protein
MGRASAKVVLRGPISEAESLWYDHRRWAAFVEGFAHVVKLEGDWPRPGSRVVWDSARDGRGRVVERVVAFEPRVGQTLEVEDPKLRGTQRVAFQALDGESMEVSLELRYALKKPGIGGPLLDLLFIRRAVGDSLRRTLARFGRELEAERDPTL